MAQFVYTMPAGFNVSLNAPSPQKASVNIGGKLLEYHYLDSPRWIDRYARYMENQLPNLDHVPPRTIAYGIVSNAHPGAVSAYGFELEEITRMLTEWKEKQNSVLRGRICALDVEIPDGSVLIGRLSIVEEEVEKYREELRRKRPGNGMRAPEAIIFEYLPLEAAITARLGEIAVGDNTVRNFVLKYFYELIAKPMRDYYIAEDKAKAEANKAAPAPLTQTVAKSDPLTYTFKLDASTFIMGDYQEQSTMSEIKEQLKDEFIESAYFVGATQVSEIARRMITELLQSQLPPNSKATRAKVAAFMESEIGTVLSTFLLSAVITQSASLVEEHFDVSAGVAAELASKMRVLAMTQGGNAILQQTILPHLEPLFKAIRSLPEPKALGQGNGVTVREVLSQPVKVTA